MAPTKQRRRSRRKAVLGLYEGVGIALEAIWGNKLRSFLTVLGNVIAITSIILVVSIIQGLDAEVTNIFASQGTDVFSVVRSDNVFSQFDEQLARSNPRLKRAEADILRDEGTTFGAVMTSASSGARVEYREIDLDSTAVQGRSYEFALVDTFGIATGRYFSVIEARRNRAVAIVGAKIAEELFPGLPAAAALDKRIRINGLHFTVIGVLEARGSLLGRSQDEFIVVPIGAFERLFGRRAIGSITIKPRDPDELDAAVEEARLLMRIERRLRPGDRDNFGITSADTFIDIYRSATSGIYTVLVSVVAMSLIVGGIVIMNIMLMVVTERTREIGIRKAVGASYQAILWQFLVEAVTLSLAGGVFGIIGATPIRLRRGVSGVSRGSRLERADASPAGGAP